MIDTITDNAGLIGLVFFFSFFVGVLVWILAPSKREMYKDFGNIPIKDNDDE